MINYSFPYLPFIRRVYNHSKTFILLLTFGYIFSLIFTSKPLITFLLYAFFLVIILFKIFKCNKYFIQQITINENDIYITVWKYNTNIINETIEISKVKFEKQIASSSPKGVSYKLNYTIANQKFSQYETMGWKKKILMKLLRLCRNQIMI